MHVSSVIVFKTTPVPARCLLRYEYQKRHNNMENIRSFVIAYTVNVRRSYSRRTGRISGPVHVSQ